MIAHGGISGYNDHMVKPSSIVGSRELKTRLGQYLERVRRGETILVTDRDVPVAELRPVQTEGSSTAAALRKMAAEGLLTLGTGGRLKRFTPIRTRDNSGSSAIAADRDERF